MQIQQIPFAIVLALMAWSLSARPIPATEDGTLGLYPSHDFLMTDGSCKGCKTIPQALWYFKGETLAVPTTQPSDFSRTAQAQADLADWLAGNPTLGALPPLIWLGSEQVIAETSLSADGKRINDKDGSSLNFDIEAKIPTNRSYWNDRTLNFFRQRPVRLRGQIKADKFIARTVWPLDYTIMPGSNPSPLMTGETLKSLVQFDNGGAVGPYQARLLWERNPETSLQAPGKAVLGFMLNGAQGDDDEAHGGHFGVITGRFEEDGNYSRWLVNNFYDLDSYSEKGIIAAITPMDKYLMDLNNGQSYYRPSYLLVATFKDEHAVALYQSAINRVYNHFYRHDFEYDHSRNNCTGVSIDTLRTLGWHVPFRGVESYLKSGAAYVYVATTEGSLEKGRKVYDYLSTELTRLNPAVAFDAMGNDLLALAQGQTGRDLSDLEQSLAQNIEAIWFVRIPQIPSSRAFGNAPVYSFAQYLEQAPADHHQWKIIPVEPRPFPNEMRDGLALQQSKPFSVPLPIGLLGLIVILILLKFVTHVFKRRFIIDCKTSKKRVK